MLLMTCVKSCPCSLYFWSQHTYSRSFDRCFSCLFILVLLWNCIATFIVIIFFFAEKEIVLRDLHDTVYVDGKTTLHLAPNNCSDTTYWYWISLSLSLCYLCFSTTGVTRVEVNSVSSALQYLCRGDANRKVWDGDGTLQLTDTLFLSFFARSLSDYLPWFVSQSCVWCW